MTAIFTMPSETLKITVENAAMKGKKLETFAKIRTFSSFILTAIARIWLPVFLLCHVKLKLF